ncbi:hypothetical protein EJ02DRAFT_408168 [Clathrospora elynae]|uniref:Uncharacterized protein n=1 Tax=Clathrospora elynae TaxID=706981 RepID=A0A6A5SJ88_9PLEO|nr:hypothetical protein EJ02DRAFT_408168 [Clathrospora elynae]
MVSEMLIGTLHTTVHLLTSFLISFFTLPVFLIWRIALYMLLPIEKALQAFFIPTLAIYMPAHSNFLRCWQKVLAIPAMAPIVNYWVRIVCSTLLLIQIILALALFIKSCILFLPWFIKHFQNHDYKHEQKKLWWNDLLLHLAGFVVTCAPFASVFGVGMSILYYARKIWVYGRFQKKMRRKPGGRGYFMEEEEEKEKGMGKGAGKSKTVETRVPRGMFNYPETRPEREAIQVNALEPMTVFHGFGVNDDGAFFDTEAVQEPRSEIIQQPHPVARYRSNPYTWKGVSSIWGARDKLKSGYDGRETRWIAFEGDMEMADRSGRR